MEKNNDLALFASSVCKKGHHKSGECIPEHIELGATYDFLKKGHRTYEVPGEVTLLEMQPDEVLFDIRARVEITDVSYEIEEGQSYTKGQYKVLEILRA